MPEGSDYCHYPPTEICFFKFYVFSIVRSRGIGYCMGLCGECPRPRRQLRRLWWGDAVGNRGLVHGGGSVGGLTGVLTIGVAGMAISNSNFPKPKEVMVSVSELMMESIQSNVYPGPC